MKTELLNWQKECKKNWIDNQCRGIVVGSTGIGKTILAISCMEHLDTKTLVVVPKVALLKQTVDEIKKELNLTDEDIGLFYGNKKELKRITVAVINSIRDMQVDYYFKLIVLDEIHNYGSKTALNFLKKNQFEYTLGLTATIHREDNKEEDLIEIIGKVIYQKDLNEAVNEGYLSKYELINKRVELTPEEKDKYYKYTDDISKGIRYFGGLEQAKKYLGHNNAYGTTAKQMFDSIQRRKGLLNKALSKIITVTNIVLKNREKKIIIFNETIEVAEEIKNRLLNLGMKVGIYHSKSSNISAIESYKSGENNILISVKSLDEGLNVKDAEIAIIVAGNRTSRQILQRLGRILRKHGDKVAKVYQLYCKNTVEENTISKRTKLLEDSAIIKGGDEE